MMDDDQEGPPSLVDVGMTEAPSTIAAGLQDMSLTKVPLTIVTEFGDSADIEKALTVTQDGQESQEWLELGNGCICCSIKDSGVNAIESLMERRGSFDYVLLETSGLADPGNLAPLFWVDEGLGSSIYLDGVVTLVDPKNLLLSLDERSADSGHDAEAEHGGPHLTTAHLQVSHADVLIINKCDSVAVQQLAAVEDRIRSINGLAKIHRTSYSQVPQLETFLLDLHAYDGVDSLDTASQGHSHLDPSISTTTIPLPTISPSALIALETWLRSLLWDSTLPPTPHSNPPPTTSPPLNIEVHRLKARLFTTEGAVKMIQGVREVFEIVDLDDSGGSRQDGGTGEGKMVLIGRGLEVGRFKESLSAALAE